MMQESLQLALLVIIVGAITVVSLLTKTGMQRIRLPALVGFLLIGFALRGMDDAWSILPKEAGGVFDFLAKLGVIALLFAVGLKSKLQELLNQISNASFIWVGNVAISGALTLLAARWMGVDWIPSIIVSVAMVATSVGVPSAVWQRTGAVGTRDGQLFVDVAELDDISGVVFLAILFALLPQLRQIFEAGGGSTGGEAGSLWLPLLTTTGWVLGKLVLFAGACYLFARFVERYVVRFFEQQENQTDAVISIIAVAVIIAGIAGALGFSVAIGAFFAGLAFSQNRKAVEDKTPFFTLYDLLVPFFFLNIGLSVSPSALGNAWLLALVLAGVAMAAKLLGDGGFALAVTSWSGALTLGVAMIPRAEISMIVMQHSLQFGDWAVTDRVFSATVLVVLVTCLVAPPMLQFMIHRYIQPQVDGGSA